MNLNGSTTNFSYDAWGCSTGTTQGGGMRILVQNSDFRSFVPLLSLRVGSMSSCALNGLLTTVFRTKIMTTMGIV